MREMKDSGIDWIGNIPEIWSINKIKYIVQSRSVKYRLSKVGNYIGLENVESSSGHYVKSETEYVDAFYDGCEAGDLLYGKLRPNLAKVLISPYKSCCTGEFEIISSSLVGKKFLQYYMLTEEFTQAATQLTYGAKMPRVNWDDVKEFKIAYPNANEISTIVSFLDSKCSEIDSLAADIQVQIDTLEQYKRSVITEAVTKGLDKNVPMKDSGTPWCPQIPQHWAYTNPKALFSQRFERAFSGERQLTASQDHGIVYQDDFMELTGNRVVTVQKDFSILKHVEPGDFVISMRSFQGGLEYSTVKGCISSAYVMLVPNKKFVYPPFYRWFFKSSKYINAIQSTSNLVRDGQAMRYANFVKVPLFIIPLEEQKAIADYLDTHIMEIEGIISTKKEQLSVLADYKKSLIYEYVTGKKEVPNE